MRKSDPTLVERTPDRNPALADFYFYRDTFVARAHAAALSRTHVIVGDHPPERRVDHHRHTPWQVKLDDRIFTVAFATNGALGGEPGVLYYEFAERPGELFRADRCIEFSTFGPSDAPRWLYCTGEGA